MSKYDQIIIVLTVTMFILWVVLQLVPGFFVNFLRRFTALFLLIFLFFSIAAIPKACTRMVNKSGVVEYTDINPASDPYTAWEHGFAVGLFTMLVFGIIIAVARSEYARRFRDDDDE